MSDFSNQPFSEQYHSVAKQWVDADAAASLLEDAKSAFLAQKMAELGNMPVSKAELTVKSSPEWVGYIEKMSAARKSANLLKVKLEWIRMRFSEQQSFEATKRAEMKL